MKPIGYYAGFLSDNDQQEITNACKHSLLDLVTDLTLSMDDDHAFKAIQIEDFWLNHNTHLNKIALIRGLCDRIELKLMEVAE